MASPGSVVEPATFAGGRKKPCRPQRMINGADAAAVPFGLVAAVPERKLSQPLGALILKRKITGEHVK
jgi:hypothetical protein